MTNKQIRQKYGKYVLPNYSKTGIAFVRGSGSWLWDADGNKYLDFFPGWGVNGLGHCHPKVVSAIREQAGRLLHVANNYDHPWQADLAEKISKASFGGLVYFCNSGAEAIESAIKLARRWGNAEGRYEVIAMKNSFHGRTLAAVTATGQDKYHEGFAPLVDGFSHVPFNDLEAVRGAITAKTAAILVEPIQGEGGIHAATPEFMKGLRNLCDQRRLLLILDEVQTGMGRTGKMFCYQHYGIQPDVMTLAKSLGGGVPIGAMVADRKLNNVLVPGTHATTFGGGALVTRAGLAVFDVIRKGKLVQRAARMGDYLKKRLERMAGKYLVIHEIRGKGLMVGVELAHPGKEIVAECLKRKLLINCTQEKVLRIMPALTVTSSELDQGLEILEGVLAVT
ncbi:MAG: aspartate aminotransferase family protein [Candidatus Omnitrophica bacterium]|nr:aspartate aminotransferase family protein [Candidatus Omnitrophota bacterium]